MSTLGQRLREERERKGLSIQDLATQTRIHVDYFQAIESDDTSALPGGFFYRSFVRQYARLLDLPESVYQPELTRSLESEIQDSSSRDTALPNRPISVPRMPTGRTDPVIETRRWAIRLAALIFVISCCTGAVFLYQRWILSTSASNEPAQESAPLPVPSPPVSQGPQTTKPEAVPPPPEAQTDPEPAANAATPATAPIAHPQPTGPVRLILRASELTWVGVWQGQRVLFSDIIRPGETRGFGAEDKLRVRLGNAGGVELEWNGRVIPPPGPKGQVRTVDFWADGYSVVQPPAPKTEEPPVQPG